MSTYHTLKVVCRGIGRGSETMKWEERFRFFLNLNARAGLEPAFSDFPSRQLLTTSSGPQPDSEAQLKVSENSERIPQRVNDLAARNYNYQK